MARRPRSRRPLRAAFLCVALLAAGCAGGGDEDDTAAPTTSAAPGSESTATIGTLPPAAQIAWTKCGRFAECGTLSVPLDYANPAGERIDIAITRTRASGARIGSLLINPGGPGGSGFDFLTSALFVLSPAVQQRFDIVGFDPRGVARSSPVRCADDKKLDAFVSVDPVPDDAQERQALIDTTKDFVAGCQARSAKLLPFVGTADAARDMDQLRAALGDEKLTYLGFSYGTYLGAVYAGLFPQNVRALVLDGAVDPSLDVIAGNRAQGAGFDQAFDAFVRDCQADRRCAWRPPGGDLKAAFAKLAASIEARPLVVGGRRLTSGTFFYGVAQPLYDRSDWPSLAAALQAASDGDGSELLRFADQLTGREDGGGYDNSLEANVAVNCLDDPAPKDLAVYDEAARQVASSFFSAALAYSGIVCGLWPVPAKGKGEPIRAAGSPPIMVVGTTGDPATPYAGAQALASQLEKGFLVTRRGEGHVAYPYSSCVRGHADAYLLNLTVPKGSPTC